MIKYSKISSQRIRRILELFLSDFTATQSAEILGLSRNTLNRYYGIFREEIVELSIQESQESGEFEVDESYFGAKRVRWKRGRWAAGKTPVFGLLKRNGNVYVSIVEDCSRDELMPIIQGKVLEWSTIHSDGWKAYDGLVDPVSERHFRVNHWDHEFSKGNGIHINGIENFWSYTKRRLNKFNWVKVNFHLHLKECEWRYTREKLELETELLTMIKIFYKKSRKS